MSSMTIALKNFRDSEIEWLRCIEIYEREGCPKTGTIFSEYTKAQDRIKSANKSGIEIFGSFCDLISAARAAYCHEDWFIHLYG